MIKHKKTVPFQYRLFLFAIFRPLDIIKMLRKCSICQNMLDILSALNAYLITFSHKDTPETYSQNVGLVQLSGVKTKNVIYTMGTMLIILGFVPKIGALTTVIPTPVLGGAMVAMFGMVIAYGIKMLSKVEFASQENLLIIACSVGMGLGVTAVPDLFAQLPESVKILTNNGIVAGSLTAIFLNIVFNVTKPVKQTQASKTSSQGAA
jgi:xanthine permease